MTEKFEIPKAGQSVRPVVFFEVAVSLAEGGKGRGRGEGGGREREKGSVIERRDRRQ